MNVGRKIQESVKHLFIPGALFEELGLRYFGPLNGNELSELIPMLFKVKEIEGPILLHVITKKGKGFRPAESDPTKFHGLGKFDKETGASTKACDDKSYSVLFGETLTSLAEDDKDIIAITAAMAPGTGLNIFADRFPNRFFDVGIAEQHAITFSAGLALGGYKPVVAIYSSFMQRAYDQLIHDVALQNLPVKLFMDRAGLVGDDGETHQGMFDISFIHAVPNLVFMSPKDGIEFQDMIYTALKYNSGPVAVRYPRGNVKVCRNDKKFKEVEIGKAEVLSEGKSGTIIALGKMVELAEKVRARLLKQGLDVGVVNARFIKPLDTELFRKLSSNKRPIITIEDNTLIGGFGSTIDELFTESGIFDVRILNLGLPDKFIEHGSIEELFNLYHLDEESVTERIINFLK